MPDGARVLIVDGDAALRQRVALHLERSGFRARGASASAEGLSLLHEEPFDVLVLEAGAAGALARLLGEVERLRPGLPVVITARRPTLEAALGALRQGARDFVPKPFTPEELEQSIVRVCGPSRRPPRPSAPESVEAALEVAVEPRSPGMIHALRGAARAATADVPVLVRGENGTGKNVLARKIHEASARHRGPFVVVNCPSLSEELLMSELFGHVRGAFTGAVQDHAGRVEAAESGTLFLDEIGEIPPRLQAKLLRFLQEKMFERVGESRARKADVRVLAATSRALEVEVEEGRFRQDLWFRLNVIELTLPPLREREEDILPLAREFLSFFARKAGREALTFSTSAQELLAGYSWPGNVRELRNAVERAVILWPGRVLEPAAFPERMSRLREAGPRLGGRFTLREIEEEHIERVTRHSSNLEEAARILGIDDSTLWRKRKKRGQLQCRREPEVQEDRRTP